MHQPYYKLLKIGVCNGSADTALNIGMNSTTIIMQGQMGKKNTWLLNAENKLLSLIILYIWENDFGKRKVKMLKYWKKVNRIPQFILVFLL